MMFERATVLSSKSHELFESAGTLAHAGFGEESSIETPLLIDYMKIHFMYLPLWWALYDELELSRNNNEPSEELLNLFTEVLHRTHTSLHIFNETQGGSDDFGTLAMRSMMHSLNLRERIEVKRQDGSS